MGQCSAESRRRRSNPKCVIFLLHYVSTHLVPPDSWERSSIFGAPWRARRAHGQVGCCSTCWTRCRTGICSTANITGVGARTKHYQTPRFGREEGGTAQTYASRSTYGPLNFKQQATRYILTTYTTISVSSAFSVMTAGLRNAFNSRVFRVFSAVSARFLGPEMRSLAAVWSCMRRWSAWYGNGSTKWRGRRCRIAWRLCRECMFTINCCIGLWQTLRSVKSIAICSW